MKARILVIGNIYLDSAFHLDGMPLAGDLAQADSYYEGIGGRAAEVALAAGKLSGNTIMLSRIGEDATGRRIRDFLKGRGVDVRFLSETPDAQTGILLHLSDDTGTREIRFTGAAERLTMKDAERAFLSSPDAVYLNFDVPYEVAVASCRFAKMKGIPLFLSAYPLRKDFPFDLLEQVDTVFLDEQAARHFIGCPVTSLEGCMKATLELRSKIGAKCVVLRRAEKGLYISQGKYYQTVTPYAMRKEDEDFSHAAFEASFILYYLQHRVYEQACEYANIAGTLTAAKKGKLSSVPTPDEVERFARENCPQLARKGD